MANEDTINVNPSVPVGYSTTPMSDVEVLVDGQTSPMRLGAALSAGTGPGGFNQLTNFNSANGTNPRPLTQRAQDGGIYVADFLDQVVGGDYAPAYNAAIAAAYNAGIRRIFGLPYRTRVDSTIYLDAPGNLQSNFANPTIFHFSLELVGQGADSADRDGGTTLLASFDNAPVLAVGPGTGMLVEDVSVAGQVSVRHPKLHATNNYGIMVSGGDAGAQQTTIRRCNVYNVYNAFAAGPNNNSFAETTTWELCNADGCYIDYKNYSQNSIASMVRDCKGNGSIGTAGVSRPMNVDGGEFNPGVGPAKKATIGTISGLTLNAGVYTFTGVITSPDTNWADGVYNAGVIQTAHFGNVPVEPISFNSGTNTATFRIYQPWYFNAFGSVNLISGTDIQAELQAATTVYVCEYKTIYSNSYVDHQSPEYQTSVCFFESGEHSGLRNTVSNTDISLQFYYAPGTDNYAHVLVQSVFPFIRTVGPASVTVDNNDFNGHFTPGPVVIEFNQNTGDFTWNNNNIGPLNLTHAQGDTFPAPFYNWYNLQGRFSNILFDRFVFAPTTSGGAGPSGTYKERNNGSRRTPYYGWLASQMMPVLKVLDVDSISGATSLASTYISNPNPNWDQAESPLIDHSVHQVSQPGTQFYTHAKNSAAGFDTYGFDLDVAANTKGVSPFLNLTGGNNKDWIFVGLSLGMDTGNGEGVYHYATTGRYYNIQYPAEFNYCSIARFYRNDTGAYSTDLNGLRGTKTTVYNFASIVQQPFVMQKFGYPVETVPSLLSSLPATQNLVAATPVYRTSMAYGESPGWWITIGGAAGSAAVYCPMPDMGLNTRKRVTSQFNKTSDVALANITGLSITVQAGKSYEFNATLFTTSNVAGGVQAAIAGTATATAIIYEGETTAAAAVGAQTRATALGTAVGGITAVIAARIDIEGLITVNAAGTLTVQFAQNVSNGTASSVLVGSYFDVRECI